MSVWEEEREAEKKGEMMFAADGWGGVSVCGGVTAKERAIASAAPDERRGVRSGREPMTSRQGSRRRDGWRGGVWGERRGWRGVGGRKANASVAPLDS